MSDALLAGVPVGFALALAVVYWRLLVAPERVAALFRRPGASASWLDVHPGALRAVRVLVGVSLFAITFWIGLSVAFLVMVG